MGRFVDTRWQLTVVRLGILAFKIAIVVILILAVLTPMTGGVKVNMPDLKEDLWTFDNGTARFEATIGVYNGGMFDVNDFSIDFGLTDPNSTVVASSNTDHTSIRSGQWNNLDMRMDVDLNNMNETVLRSLVFNATKFTMAVDVGATYPLGWVAINFGGNSSYDWQPLVKDYNVDVNNATFSQTGGQYSLSVPYHLSVSNWLNGQSMDLKVTMRNDSGTMATTDQRIVLQEETYGDLVLNITDQAAMELMTHEEHLHFDVQAGYMTANVTKTVDYDWQPPVSGLGIGQPYLQYSPQAIIVPFQFDTSAPVTGNQMTFASTMAVNDTPSGSGSTTIMANPSNYVALQIPVSSATMTYLQTNSATLTFKITMTSNGLTGTQTVQYQWSP